ncbi:hypothetical protein HCG46_08865 [Labrenzia sp. PO1]|uniref:capsular polysaccharide export protein, LipB/KpsS family n=1 Tax=Stappiaceae TaxID=2821832 RepID=UPI000A6286E9|nr:MULTISPECIES: hypothetical protein [Stappiaceae]NKI58365.1 hypothetical protein [Labrenzia sp. PO1]UFI05704.1 hypothetical protein ST40_011395 [Roseibium aggregatum]
MTGKFNLHRYSLFAPIFSAKKKGLFADKSHILTKLDKSNPTLFFGFSAWKHRFYNQVFSEQEVLFLGDELAQDDEVIEKIFSTIRRQKVFVWSYKDPFWLSALSARNHVTICRVEDGFLRSVGLGAEKTAPSSIVIEEGTNLYFHKERDSRLHQIIRSLSDDELKDFHRKGIELQEKIISNNLTKYNFARRSSEFHVEKGSILVIGQVERDESIRRGPDPYFTCEKLIEIAYRDNPGQSIHFKAHPEVLKGFAQPFSAPFRRFPELVEFPRHANMFDYANRYERIYTISSLAGFELLLRGASITTLGSPWYAGWGLTDDRATVLEARQEISVQVLLWAAYGAYPYYFDQNGQMSDVFKIVDSLSSQVKTAKDDAFT